MAGSQIAVPINGASVWTDFVTIVQRNFRGWLQLTLTNPSGTSEPAIAAGSAVEVGGAMYTFDSEEAITGWSGISDDTNVWIKVVPSGSSITAEFTDTDPTWSDAKQGWYDSNDRYVGWLRRDSSSLYSYKHVLPVQYQYHLILDEVLEIGDWNMNSTALISPSHELGGDTWRIRSAECHIRGDADAAPLRLNPLDQFVDAPDPTLRSGGIQQWGDTDVGLWRRTGGAFDNGNFESTSYNRGWLYFSIEVLTG